MQNQLRVLTTDLKVVKVQPVAKECDELSLVCAAVDSEGNLYVWGDLKYFLPNEKHIIEHTWESEKKLSDDEWIRIHDKFIKELLSTD